MFNPEQQYHAQMVICKLDHNKFEDMQQSLYGKTIVDKLEEDFEILYSFRATCAQLLEFSYVEHVELRVLAKEMAILKFPTIEQ